MPLQYVVTSVPAVFDELAHLLFKACAVHIEHRRNDKLIFRDVAVHIDDVHLHALIPERTVVRQERLHVFFVFILVARARGSIQRPAVFHVVHDGDLRLDFGAVYVVTLIHALKLSADGLAHP